MVRLLLVNVDAIGTHHKDSLSKLNIVDEADKLVFAVAKNATKPNYAENGKDPLKEEGKGCHTHQALADIEVVLLDLLQLVGKFSLLLHVACLLFASAITHFLTRIVNVILVHGIILTVSIASRSISISIVPRLLTKWSTPS